MGVTKAGSDSCGRGRSSRRSRCSRRAGKGCSWRATSLASAFTSIARVPTSAAQLESGQLGAHPLRRCRRRTPTATSRRPAAAPAAAPPSRTTLQCEGWKTINHLSRVAISKSGSCSSISYHSAARIGRHMNSDHNAISTSGCSSFVFWCTHPHPSRARAPPAAPPCAAAWPPGAAAPAANDRVVGAVGKWTAVDSGHCKPKELHRARLPLPNSH